MDLKINTSIGAWPIVVGLVGKLTDEYDVTKLIIGALLSLVLMGMGFNLNSIATDLREMRKAIAENALAAKEEAFKARQELAIVTARQQDVMKNLEEVKKDVKKHLENK